MPNWGWAAKAMFWLALMWSLKVAQPLVAPIAFAVVLAFVMAPGVRAMRRRGLPVAAGAALMIAAVLLAVALLGGALARPAAQWWERAPRMVAELVVQIDRARAAITLPGAAPKTSPQPARDGAITPPPPTVSDPLRDKLASEGMVLTGALLARVGTFAVSATATLILLFFLLTSERWILSRVVEALPARRTRALVLSGLRNAERDIGRFLGSLGLIYGSVGALTMMAVAWFGLPNPLLWGVLTALLNFVPYLGPVLIAALLFLASLVSFEPGPIVFGPPLVFMLIHAIEANFVSPWFVAQRLMLSPIAVFVSVLFWAWMWGVTGAVIAVPLLVGLRSVSKRHRGLTLLHVLLQGDRVKPPSLRALLRVVPRRGVGNAGTNGAGARRR